VLKISTISDVAKLAGLSVSTVSRVINNKKYVKDEKKAAVLAAMKELNYQPSLAARQLRGQQSKTIGVIVPRITNPFFSYLVNEIQQQSYKHGYQIMIFQSDEDVEKEASFFDLLAQKQIDGVILCAFESRLEVLEKYSEYGPIIVYNKSSENSTICSIDMDQGKGAYLGIKYLLDKGYRNIAYCTGGRFVPNERGEDRDKGYLKALQEYNLNVNRDWIFCDQHTIEDGKKLAKKFKEMAPIPEALFTGSDEVAAGFIIESKRLGISIPNDVAVMGFDNQNLAELTTPSITTIAQPIKALGIQTIEYMIALLENKNYEVNYDNLEMKVVIRESA